MKNAIILHGLQSKSEYYKDTHPSASNMHWLPWLQKELMIRDIRADTPEMFKGYEPKYSEWVKEVERFDITPETMLVGHSMGGGFWVRYLSEHPDIHVDKVVLVAPWLNLEHEAALTFFDFTIDPELIHRVNQLTIFASDDDDIAIQNTVALLTNTFPTATLKTFHEYGHFTLKSMKTTAFPELLTSLV